MSSIPTNAVDAFVTGSLTVFVLILLALVLSIGWAYVVKTDPDPRRWSIRASIVVAMLIDQATWPARGER